MRTGGHLWSGVCLSFPLPGGKLPGSWAGLWVGQRAVPQVYQAEPPQRRRFGNLTTEIVSSQVCAQNWEEQLPAL